MWRSPGCRRRDLPARDPLRNGPKPLVGGRARPQRRWQARPRSRKRWYATISILLGNGNGTFAPQLTYPAATAPLHRGRRLHRRRKVGPRGRELDRRHRQCVPQHLQPVGSARATPRTFDARPRRHRAVPRLVVSRPRPKLVRPRPSRDHVRPSRQRACRVWHRIHRPRHHTRSLRDRMLGLPSLQSRARSPLASGDWPRRLQRSFDGRSLSLLET